MSGGKKVKINIKKGLKAAGLADEANEHMDQGQSLSAGQADDDHTSQSGSYTQDIDNHHERQQSDPISLEQDRLDEFLARDVDFTGLEAQASADDQTSKLKAELAEANDRYLRAIADLENFRKHSLKERSELLKYQGEKVILDLLEVIDNFELALQHKDAEVESLRTGLTMIHKQMLDVLERWGVKAEQSVGLPFDPQKHNAVNKVPSDEVPAGSIVAELKKSYFYKDKLLRVGNVIVAASPDEQE